MNAVPGEPIDGFDGMVCAETIGADREIRSVLAMPILNESRNVLGESQENFRRNLLITRFKYIIVRHCSNFTIHAIPST